MTHGERIDAIFDWVMLGCMVVAGLVTTSLGIALVVLLWKVARK